MGLRVVALSECVTFGSGVRCVHYCTLLLYMIQDTISSPLLCYTLLTLLNVMIIKKRHWKKGSRVNGWNVFSFFFIWTIHASACDGRRQGTWTWTRMTFTF